MSPLCALEQSTDWCHSLLVAPSSPVCFPGDFFLNYAFAQLAQSHLITQLGRPCAVLTVFAGTRYGCRGVPMGHVELPVPKSAPGPSAFVWDPF